MPAVEQDEPLRLGSSALRQTLSYVTSPHSELHGIETATGAQLSDLKEGTAVGGSSTLAVLQLAEGSLGLSQLVLRNRV